LRNNRYGVCLSWDRVKSAVDLDLQAVIVDSPGTIIDAVYYNRLEIMDKGLSHSGDEKTGEGEGFDESIWLNFQKIKKDVKLIIFIIAAHAGGCFSQAGDVSLHIVEQWHGNTLETVRLKNGVGGVMPVATAIRGPEGDWVMMRINKAAEDGNHFMDILEPTLGDYIRKKIKGAPARQRVSFPMAKGGSTDLPRSSSLKRVSVGVGWDMGGAGIDLDVSAVLFGVVGQKVGAVYYNNPKAYGLNHTGDNETGAGEGDDETIAVDLESVPAQVAQIFFIVNIYTKGITFQKLKNAHCRVTNDYGEELTRYSLNCAGAKDDSGLILARLHRNQKTQRWGFHALGSFCQGRKWMDRVCLKEMQRLFYLSPRDIATDVNQMKTQEGARSKAQSPMAARFQRKSAQNRAARLGSTYCLANFERGSSGSSRVRVGVGWDILATKKGDKTSVDLDVAAVFFHKEGRDIGALDYENIEEYGMRHSGDNETGEGDGDDEVIDVDLDGIPEDVAQVFFIVTVYTKGMDFQNIENAYCRVIDHMGDEIVRHDLTSSGSASTGLVIAQLFRHPENGWTFKRRSNFIAARTWLDPALMGEMRRLFKETIQQYDPLPECPQPQNTPSAIMWRGSTHEQILGCEAGRSSTMSGQSVIVSL